MTRLPKSMNALALIVLLLSASVNLSNGFVIRPTTTTLKVGATKSSPFMISPKSATLGSNTKLLLNNKNAMNTKTDRKQVICQMSYNLPPSNDKDNEFGDIVKGALGIFALAAFFASPLGGIFFAIVNSFFALAILTPLVAVVAFQGWQYFNTISGPCPNCGAPVKVLKDDSPSICLNCGTFVRSSADKSGIDFAGGGNDIFSSGDAGDADFFGDLFDQAVGVRRSPMTPEEEKSAERRQQTIIDIEVEKDDK